MKKEETNEEIFHIAEKRDVQNKNKVEVSIELVGAEETLKKLQEIKKLTNETQETNYDIKDLRQKLINYLYNLHRYETNDIELIKILFNGLK